MPQKLARPEVWGGSKPRTFWGAIRWFARRRLPRSIFPRISERMRTFFNAYSRISKHMRTFLNTYSRISKRPITFWILIQESLNVHNNWQPLFHWSTWTLPWIYDRIDRRRARFVRYSRLRWERRRFNFPLKTILDFFKFLLVGLAFRCRCGHRRFPTISPMILYL
jgi:hypothetical protein